MPQLGDNIDLRPFGVPIVLGYDLFDADANVIFTANQTLTFTPSVQIKLSFATAPSGISGPFDSKAADNSWVIFEPGAEISIQFPAGRRDAIEVTPEVLLSGTLRNQSHLGTSSNIVMLAGRYDYQLPEYEIFPTLGPFDTGLSWPHLHGTDHWHDSVCSGCELHIHSHDHCHSDGICWPFALHDHWHDTTICTSCIFHLHDVSTHQHDIVVGPWGPVVFPGLDITLDPVWGPETYAENAGPDTDLADETFDVTFAPLSLSNFLLEPNDPPLADPGGPYSVDEGSSVIVTGNLSSDEEGDPMTYSWDLDSDGSFESDGISVPFFGVDGPADHTVTLQVCDPYTCDEAVVLVHVNNVAPTAEAGAGKTVYRNDLFSLQGSWTDPAGSFDDQYTWSWDLDGAGGADDSGDVGYGSTIFRNTSLPLEGFFDLLFGVSDKDGAYGSDHVTIEVLNRPPDCSNTSPSVDTIWPPNHKMVSVNVNGVTDPEGDATTITVTSIWQDEPVSAKGSGNFGPEVPAGSGVATDTAYIRAERIGDKKTPGNGRVYVINYTADDGHGGQCTGAVSVGVPHDASKDAVAVNDGAVYDSTAP